MDYFLVYGTLRADAACPMHDVLARNATYAEPGWLRGTLYQIDWYPGYVPTTRLDQWVRGDVYCVPDAPRLFWYLDTFEEINEQDERASEYLRRRCLVRLAGGRWRTAWTYVYNQPPDAARLIRSGDFLNQ